MHRSLIIAALVAALGIGGCADMSGVRPYWRITTASFDPIKPGVTKDEVERHLGKPITSIVFRNINEEVWDYRYLEGTRIFLAEVHFDLQQGRVKYYTQYPDNAFIDALGNS